MTLHEKYLKILSGLIPAGAVGLSCLLGSTTPSAADVQSSSTNSVRVAERLAAIREAVSAVVASETTAAEATGRLAWGNVKANTRWANLWSNLVIDRWGNNWPNNWGNYWHNH